MPLLTLANELLLLVVKHLRNLEDFHSLTLTNRRLSALVAPSLHKYAAGDDKYALVALVYANVAGNEAMVRAFLNKRLYIVNGETPISNRDTSGSSDALVKQMLSQGANFIVIELAYRWQFFFGAPALCWAAKRGNKKLLLMLLEKGVDIESKDDMGHTALHNAAVMGHAEIVHTLLEKGADISIRGSIRVEPISYTNEYDYRFKVADCLVEYVNDSFLYGGPGVEYKVRWDYNTTRFSLRIGEGETHWVPGTGFLPVEWAHFHEKYTSACLILYKTPVNFRHSFGETALSLAVKYHHEELARALLDKGADVEALTGFNKEKPLYVAVRYGKPKMVKLLLEYGADANGLSSNSLTALHGIADKETIIGSFDDTRTWPWTQMEAVDVLLDSNINRRDRTALYPGIVLLELHTLEKLEGARDRTSDYNGAMTKEIAVWKSLCSRVKSKCSPLE